MSLLFTDQLRRIVALMLGLIAALTVAAIPSNAYAQSEPGGSEGGGGGWVDDFTSVFSWENTTSFEDRKAAARETIDGIECATCKIFKEFSVAVFSASSNVDAAGSGLVAVLTGVASVFALWYLGSAFVSGDASDLLGRWQVFWRLCLAVTGGSIFLQKPLTYAWDYIFWPLFSIGEGIVNMVGGQAGSCGAVNGGIVVSLGSGSPAGAQKAIASMSQTVCGTYSMTLDGIASGMALVMQSGSIMEALVYAVVGLLIILLYGFLAIVFPLRFIDVVIKLAIVGFLTPILGLCAVFKPTRGYVGVAISNVLNATAQFAIMSIIFRIGDDVFTAMNEAMGVGGADFIGTILNGLVMFGTAFVFVGLVNAVPGIASEIARHSGGGGGEGGAAASSVISKPASVAAGGAGAAMRVAGGAAVNQKVVGNALKNAGLAKKVT